MTPIILFTLLIALNEIEQEEYPEPIIEIECVDVETNEECILIDENERDKITIERGWRK